jgi:methylmalonyl-CoA epimerase
VINRIYHLGFAVEDIEAASRFYEENFGAVPGEPEVVEEQGIVATMFKVGESSIELVQPTRPDSPVGKFLEKRGEGFHHVAFEVEDLSVTLAELKRNGVEVIDEEPRRGAGGTRMAFVHPRGAFGVLTELVELPHARTGAVRSPGSRSSPSTSQRTSKASTTRRGSEIRGSTLTPAVPTRACIAAGSGPCASTRVSARRARRMLASSTS